MYAFFGLCILAGTALVGIAVSFLMRPVFIYRDMLPSMGCFWFGFVSLLSRQKKKRVLVPARVLLCLVGAADYSACLLYTSVRPDQIEEEFLGCVDLAKYCLTTLGLEEDVTYRLSKWDQMCIRDRFIALPIINWQKESVQEHLGFS